MELVSLVVLTIQTVDIPDEESKDIDATSDLEEAQTSQPIESFATSKPKRVIHKPSQYIDTLAYALPVIEEFHVPKEMSYRILKI